MSRAPSAFSGRTPLWLLFALLVIAGPGLARPYDEKTVKRDSPAIQAVYREPLASDPYALKVALEKLRLAQDHAGATALERHLAQRALAVLGRGSADTRGTIGDLVAHPPAEDLAPSQAVLKSSLKGRLVRTEGHEVVAEVENASGHALERYDAFARVKRPDHDEILLQCHPEPSTNAVFAPGEARTHRCEVRSNLFELDEYFRRIADQWPAGSPLAMESTQLRFVDPPVYVSWMGAGWHGSMDPLAEARLAMRTPDASEGAQAPKEESEGTSASKEEPAPAPREVSAASRVSPGDARSEAVLAMRGLDCKARGACAEERLEKLSNPLVLAPVAGIVAGLVAGALVGFFAGRPLRSVGLLTVAALALGVAMQLWGPGARQSGYGPVLLLGLTAFALAGFLLAFWISTPFFTWLRRPRRGRAAI